MGHSAVNDPTDPGGDLWKLGYEYGELAENGTVITSKNTGNIARQTLNVPGVTFVQNYRYDSLYRLTSAKETAGETTTWSQTFQYDPYGNRTHIDEVINDLRTMRTTPEVDTGTNRFRDGQGFTYDHNGNIIQDVDVVTNQSRTFVFNGDNKQAEIRDPNGNPIGKYFYDGEGKRVKKVTDTETTVFVYSNGKLAAEYSTALPPPNPTINYTATDMLGSPRVVTNALGNVVSRRDFMPFGEDVPVEAGNRGGVEDVLEIATIDEGTGNLRTTALNYQSTDAIRQRFTGYQKDTETSLDFAEARMYESRYGRFTAVDPLLASGQSANPQTFNRYVYALNNPLLLTDPTGLQVGKWYFPVDGNGNKTGGNPEYIRNGSNTSGYAEANERNKAGELVYSADGQDSNYVIRLNPMGPASVNNPLDIDDMFFNGPYVKNGWDQIFSDKYLANTVEPVVGVRDASIEFYAAVLPLAAGGKAAIEGALAARATTASEVSLSERALELHKVLDPIAQTRRTTAVVGTEEGVNIVASSRNTLAPAQRNMLTSNEVEARGAGHAEQTAYDFASQNGLTPLKVAPSRPACTDCAEMIFKSGAKLINPFKPPR